MKQLNEMKRDIVDLQKQIKDQDIILKSINKSETSRNRADTPENWITGTEERIDVFPLSTDENDKKIQL